jgi:hypothetical protein
MLLELRLMVSGVWSGVWVIGIDELGGVGCVGEGTAENLQVQATPQELPILHNEVLQEADCRENDQLHQR